MSAEFDRGMNSLPFHTESPLPADEVKTTGAFRALREAKGMSAEDVATRLKFTVKQIQWLEAQEFDKLPRGLALKGMVKNYARLLEINPDPVLDALQPLIGSVSGGIAQHTSIRTLGTHDANQHSGRSTIVWLILILLIVIVAMGIALWQGILPANWMPTWVGAMFK